MKVKLIYPDIEISLGPLQVFFRSYPLSIHAVAACMPEDMEVRVVDERVKKDDPDEAVDLVCISSNTLQIGRAYEIADEYRTRGVPVLLGGMHATLLPEEAMQKVDAIFIGDAEGDGLKTFIQDFRAGRIQKAYRNTSLPPLDDLAPIRRELIEYRHYGVDSVQLTRGCPHDCSFCSVQTLYGRRYRKRLLENVFAELASTKRKSLFIIDDNMIADLEYCKEFLRELRGFRKWWGGQGFLQSAYNEEWLTLAEKSGCKWLCIGTETISDKSLVEIRKGMNRTYEIKEAVRRFHDHGIHVMCSFVFGCDTDDPTVFDATLEYALDADMDLPVFGVLVPYPGTEFFEKVKGEGRLLVKNHRDWSVSRPVKHVPERMSEQELYEGVVRLYREYYGLGRIMGRHVRKTMTGKWWHAAVTTFSAIGFKSFFSAYCDFEVAHAVRSQTP